MKPLTGNSAQIKFINEPKLSEHGVHKKFNERRTQLVPQIQDFIANHKLFNGESVEITFLTQGVGSLVSILATRHKKLVLKIPLSLTFSEGEAQFLNIWEQAGVKVPHVLETGKIGEHHYTLMEYAKVPTLKEKFTDEELVANKIYVELGRTLNIMHRPKATGFGRMVNGQAEFKTFKEWLSNPDLQKRIMYTKEHKLLADQHGSLTKALLLLEKHIATSDTTSYCHDDFGTQNIFATNPITVFDPNPKFNNWYLDLGKTLLIISHENPEAVQQFLAGYFGNEKPNMEVLRASLLLNAYIKLPDWHKKGYLVGVKETQEYLENSIFDR